MDVEYRILHYIDSLQNVDYMTDIISSLSNSDLDNFITNLLDCESHERVSLICLFIRDVMTFGLIDPECKKFKESYPKSKILNKIENLVFSNNHFIRSQAIYTLGKTDRKSVV